MTMFALLLPWFVRSTGAMPPARALVVALFAAAGAALLIVVVVKGFGVARLRLATFGVLVVLMFFLYGVGPFFGIPPICDATKRVIHLLDRSYSARPLADRLADTGAANETVAVFRVRRDMEYGLAFYRNHEVVNYEETGVPDEEASAGGAGDRPNGRGSAYAGRAAGVSRGPPLRGAFQLARTGTRSLPGRQPVDSGFVRDYGSGVSCSVPMKRGTVTGRLLGGAPTLKRLIV